jgi:DNA-binding NarL/FixJ family response regulator
MAIDVVDLPSAAARLADLSRGEREVLGLLAEGLTSREIAERLAVSESTVYHVVAALLDAVEFGSVAVSAGDIHRRAETRPATADELAAFDAELGPFDTDNEG